MKAWMLTLVPTMGLLAHDSYLMPAKFKVQPGSSLVVSIHNGDSFPASEHSTDPARIADIRLSDGSPVTDLRIMGRATHGLARISRGGSLYVSACLLPRSLELPGSKFEAYLQDEGLQDVIKARREKGTTATPGRESYTKCTKAYVVSTESDKGYAAAVGHPLEFVPEEDPASLRVGSSLLVRVLFRGKPLAGVQVQIAWAGGGQAGSAIAGRTGTDGRIRIPIRVHGSWRLHAVHMEPAHDQTASDWRSYWASFTFAVSEGAISPD